VNYKRASIIILVTNAASNSFWVPSRSPLFSVKACSWSCFFAVLCSMSLDLAALSTLDSVVNSSYLRNLRSLQREPLQGMNSAYIFICTSVNPRISILVSDDTESRRAEFSGPATPLEQFFKWFVRTVRSNTL
jgi:hypothetical protein